MAEFGQGAGAAAEHTLDDDIPPLRRFDAAVRVLRVHLYMAATTLLLSILVPLVAGVARLAGIAASNPLSQGVQVQLSIFNAQALIELAGLLSGVWLVGAGVGKVAGGRAGMLQLWLGLFVILWFILSDFLFPPQSLGLVAPTRYWPPLFQTIWYAAFATCIVTAAVAMFAIAGLPHPLARAQMRRMGIGHTTLKSLVRIALGPMGPSRHTASVIARAATAMLCLGWGIYLFCEIPLGLMYRTSLAETRVVLGSSFLTIEVIATSIKIVAGLGLITLGQTFLRQARIRSFPLENKGDQVDILILRPFRFDRSDFSDLDQPLSARIFDLETRTHVIEDTVLNRFAEQGLVIAVAEPDLTARPDGAMQLVLDPPTAWQDQVSDLMQREGVIVIVVDETNGVVWEMRALGRLGL